MIIRFLGTGTSQGIPVINCNCSVCLSSNPRNKRLRTSVWVLTANNSILIDIGPDFRQQALLNGITKVDAILLTHEHADHTAGMDDIRPINFSMNVKIPLYSEARVMDDLKKRFYYIFSDNPYPGLPQIVLKEVKPGFPFNINGDKINPFRIWHGTLGILGFQIEQFVYITDAKKIDQSVIKNIEGCEVLVINALQQKEHHSHLNLAEAKELIKAIQPQKTYLTHISHRLGLHEVMEKQLDLGIHLAYDGLQINL